MSAAASRPGGEFVPCQAGCVGCAAGNRSSVRAHVDGVGHLRFDDGSPVRAASALAPLGDGWLIAQDDATHAAWRRESSVVPLRVLPPVEGLDMFSEAAGTKHLKPDFEAACEVMVDGQPGVLLLGSGSTPARMRASLVRLTESGPRYAVVSLAPLYDRVATTLGVTSGQLNLEGACRLGDRVRWFNRGNLVAGMPSASVDVDLQELVSAVTGAAARDAVTVGHPLRYELGDVDGVGLAVTDAVALPDGRVLLSAAAEDTPNAVDDGPVVGTALALVVDDQLIAVTPLARPDGTVDKVEGLGLREVDGSGVRLLAVVDNDDPLVPSSELLVSVDGL
jgi:hypothetical protein